MDRDAYRLNQASVVYQSFHLFPLLTALENVMLPMEFKKMKKREAAERAKALLARVGLDPRIGGQFPKMMSGGEQQRVAIARRREGRSSWRMSPPAIWIRKMKSGSWRF